MQKYHVVDSCDHPVAGWGGYRKVGIIRREDGQAPSQIRDTKAQSIVVVLHRLYAGKTEDSVFYRAFRTAEELVKQLNAGEISEDEAYSRL